MRPVLWPATLLLLSLGPGCPRRDAGQDLRLKMLAQVDVVDRSRPSDRVAGVSEEVVARWVTHGLREAKGIQLKDKPGKDVYRLRLELGVGPRDGEHVALVSARADVPGDLERVVLQASVVQTLAHASPAAVRKVVDTVVQDIQYQARLVVGDEQSLARSIAREKDEQRLAAAVEIAAVRRARPAVPVLIKLLRHKDLQVADRAIGALVAIGDRKAVRPLTRLSRFSDTEKLAKILDGIGSLGGKEAREYLELVASGHEDADIRNLAREALQRMQRSGAETGKTHSGGAGGRSRKSEGM